MLRHCVPLTRCGVGCSCMSLAHSARYQLSLARLCLSTVQQAAPLSLSQSLPWHSTSYRLLFEQRTVPDLSRILSSASLCQPVPWHRTSERQKNAYYGFGKRDPEKLSKFAKFYYVFIGGGIVSIVLTPL